MTVALQNKKRITEVSTAQRQVMPAPDSSDEIKVFQATSYITCYSGEGNKYRKFLKRETLKQLLSQVHDGVPFNFKNGLTTSKELGESEYRLAVQWMRAHGLCIKNGHQVTIPSVENVRRAYTKQISEEGMI